MTKMCNQTMVSGKCRIRLFLSVALHALVRFGCSA
jgi:hypothetical protein